MDNLNKAIAEQVFGCEVADKFCVQDPDNGRWEYAYWIPGERQSAYETHQRYKMMRCMYANQEWIPIPDYSTDIAAAFTVVTRMRDLGYLSRYHESEWCVHEWIFRDPRRDWNVSFRADTVPLAICHAALRMIASVQRG